MENYWLRNEKSKDENGKLVQGKSEGGQAPAVHQGSPKIVDGQDEVGAVGGFYERRSPIPRLNKIHGFDQLPAQFISRPEFLLEGPRATRL